VAIEVVSFTIVISSFVPKGARSCWICVALIAFISQSVVIGDGLAARGEVARAF
jgi:hypothetical protein